MMSATTAGTIAGKGFDVLRDRVRIATQWWMSELRATLPPELLTRIGGVARPGLVVSVSDDGGVIGRLSRASGEVKLNWAATEFGSNAIAEVIAAQQLKRDDVTVIFGCGADQFLRREIFVPKAALAALPVILDQDILHRTPFDPDQIWHAAGPVHGDSSATVIAFAHWIIRRDLAHAELARCGLLIDDIDALTVRDDAAAPLIALRKYDARDQPIASRTIGLLAAAALVITILSFAVVLLTETVTLANIESAMVELRDGNAMPASGNRAARLYAQKIDPGVVDVWAELSRLLPDQTFLTEMQINDGAIAVTGFSSNAAQLVRIVEQSPLFAAAHLTGAITPDATEHKDHFSLAFQLRGGSAPRRKLRSGDAGSAP